MIANPQNFMQRHFELRMPVVFKEILLQIATNALCAGNVKIVNDMNSADIQVIFGFFL